MNTNLLLFTEINPGLAPEPAVYRSKSHFRERIHSEFFTREERFFALEAEPRKLQNLRAQLCTVLELLNLKSYIINDLRIKMGRNSDYR